MHMWLFVIILLCLGLTSGIPIERSSTNITVSKPEPRLTLQQSASTVVFSAAITTPQQVNVGDVIKYDRVHLNIGNGYDVSRGVFVCPVSGVYLFHLHGFSANNQALWIELYHNYNQVMTVWCQDNSGNESCGNTAAFLLVKGDEVKAVSRGQSTVYAVFSKNEVYNTFTGYLISAENPSFQQVIG